MSMLHRGASRLSALFRGADRLADGLQGQDVERPDHGRSGRTGRNVAAIVSAHAGLSSGGAGPLSLGR